ncbi:uncharacterized protein DC041_0009992 [Schistosoma bovis]|uniref:Uncharacterized protein n=1 Tax=Schistosoma bovis TaxID=6184 RepID=A0A430QUM2_SCHBO|nr:uncharacterized protein DC041_0009992 [Schistosoma bovis]
MDCNHALPQWEPENIPQNEMDIHLRKLREDQLNTLREQAINTRETVSEIDDALKELKSYRETILNLAIEYLLQFTATYNLAKMKTLLKDCIKYASVNELSDLV